MIAPPRPKSAVLRCGSDGPCGRPSSARTLMSPERPFGSTELHQRRFEAWLDWPRRASLGLNPQGRPDGPSDRGWAGRRKPRGKKHCKGDPEPREESRGRGGGVSRRKNQGLAILSFPLGKPFLKPALEGGKKKRLQSFRIDYLASPKDLSQFCFFKKRKPGKILDSTAQHKEREKHNGKTLLG